MEPVLIILVPGLVGGLVLAALIAAKRIDLKTNGPGRPLEPPSPSLINMAHIRVEGGGGLGMVAAVIVVAIVDPRIRLAIAIAAVLGIVFAAVLISRRRERGPFRPADDDSGPHSMLGLGRGPTGALPASRSDGTGLRLAVGH
jgi:hypothetical protein